MSTPVEQTVNAYAKVRLESNLGYNAAAMPSEINVLKNKKEVSNINFGRPYIRPPLTVDPLVEPVSKPNDMTRQIPRRNNTGVMNLNSHMEPARVQHAVNHVPRRKPAVVHGVNALTNKHFGIVQNEAEFFATQQGVKAVKDTLNEDRLYDLHNKMTRLQQAIATDEVEYQGGLHNTAVRRTRTRKSTINKMSEYAK